MGFSAGESGSFAVAVSGFVPRMDEPMPTATRLTNILRVSKSTRSTEELSSLLSEPTDFGIRLPIPHSTSVSGELRTACCVILEWLVVVDLLEDLIVFVVSDCTDVKTLTPVSEKINRITINRAGDESGVTTTCLLTE
mmetsp:Transcript_34673/g.81770  ORF Transcript_34673/g.81770 Transcript_34673/m.81770 type:complete len:138 (-) Transcript_34673:9-422(-)